MNRKYINHCSLIIGKFIAASNKCHEENHKKNQRLELLNQNNICYLKKGHVIVYRQMDDLVTLTLSAPLIIGLAQMHSQIKYHYLRCESDCEMYIINNNDAIDIFNKKNLWSYAFDILKWHINLYFQRDIMMINPNIRHIINEHLKYIWCLPPDVRAKTSVYSFITSRNHISRSAIHKIIQEMSNIGKIKIERGKLIYYNEI